MNCEHLKPGDEVAIRTRRWHDRPNYALGVVARRCKTSVTLDNGRVFSLREGRMEIHLAEHEPDADLVELTDEIRAMIGRAT